MRRYELMLLFRPDLEDDKLQAAVEKVTRAIVGAGGALTKVSGAGLARRSASPSSHTKPVSSQSWPVMSHTRIEPGRKRPYSYTAISSWRRKRLPRGTPDKAVKITSKNSISGFFSRN